MNPVPQPESQGPPPLRAEPVYDLEFDPVCDGWTGLLLTDGDGSRHALRARVDDARLSAQGSPRATSAAADLFDLALAVHVADRVAPHDLSGPVRQIHMSLPVRDPFRMESVRGALTDLLWMTTGSEWRFSFRRRVAPPRRSEHPVLPLGHADVEVALWSGGLDALAGLDARARTTDTPFLLVGTGASDPALGRQRDVYEHLPDTLGRRASLVQLPTRVEGVDRRHENPLSRARGLVFAIIGSAVASCFGQDRLSVYENGVGALNLPYSPADIGLAHSRSVHPETLSSLSDVLSGVLGRPFRVVNPFLFFTLRKRRCSPASPLMDGRGWSRSRRRATVPIGEWGSLPSAATVPRACCAASRWRRPGSGMTRGMSSLTGTFRPATSERSPSWRLSRLARSGASRRHPVHWTACGGG